jgi:hypothetical protein
MALDYNLQQTGPEVQERLDEVLITRADLNQEIADREAADTTLQQNINSEAQARETADSALQENIDAEETRATAAEQTNADAIAAEVTRAQNKEAELADSVNQEKQARINAAATLQNNIDAEATRAQTAEQANASALEALQTLIPASASVQNKLVDKEFMNSSIATATATFRGTYNLITDLDLTIAATHTAIAIKLGIAVLEKDKNDYVFVQIPAYAQAPTEIAKIERYKFDGSVFVYEYELNNSSFTTEQWNALNSGITSGLVEKLQALPTNSDLNTLLSGKQDTINDLQEIREGAVAGASSYQLPGTGIPATDLSEGVQESLEAADNAAPDVFGPYANVAAAHAALSAKGLNTIGRTVGITAPSNMVVEYWYQGGTEQNNLVLKQSEVAQVKSINNIPLSGDGNIEVVQADFEDLANDKGTLKLADKAYVPADFSGLGKVYLRKNMINVGLHFRKIEESFASIEADTLFATPDDIYFSTADNKFVAQKGNKYYANWSAKDSNAYINPNSNLIYVCDSNGKIYTWDDGLVETTQVGKNVLSQADINKPNTVYIIQYDYDIVNKVDAVTTNNGIFDGEHYGYLPIITTNQETYRALDGCVFVNWHNNTIIGVNLVPDGTAGEENNDYAIAKLSEEPSGVAISYYTPNGTITMPEGSVIQFEGGSINNGTIIGNGVKLSEWKFNNVTFSSSDSFEFVKPIPVPSENPKEFIETILSYKSYNSLVPTIFLFNSMKPYDWDGVLTIDKKCVVLTGGGVIRGHIQIGVDPITYKEYEQDYDWDGNRMCITISNLTFNKIGKLGRVTNGGSKDVIITQENVANFVKYATIDDAYDDNYASITLYNANHIKITDCFFHNIPFPVAYKANRAVPGEALPDSGGFKIQQIMRRVNIINCDFERCYIAIYAPSNVDNSLEYGDLEICFCNVTPQLHCVQVKNIDGLKVYNNVFNTGHDNLSFEGVNLLAEGCFMQVNNNAFYGEMNVASVVALYPSSIQLIGNGFYAQHTSIGTPYKYKGCINIIADQNKYIGYVGGCIIESNLFTSVNALPIYINKRVRGCIIDGNCIAGEDYNSLYQKTLYYIGDYVVVDRIQDNVKKQSLLRTTLLDLRIDAITEYKRYRDTYNENYYKNIDFTTSNNSNVYHVRRITKVKPVIAITGSFKNLSQCKLMFNGVCFTISGDYNAETEALTALKTKIDSLFSDDYDTSIIAGVLWIVGKLSTTEVCSPFIDLERKLDVVYQNLGYRVEIWDKDNKNEYNEAAQFAGIDLECDGKIINIDNELSIMSCTKASDKYFTLTASNYTSSSYAQLYIQDDTFFAMSGNDISSNEALAQIIALCYSDRYSISGSTITCLEANKEWNRLDSRYSWWLTCSTHVVDVKHVEQDGAKFGVKRSGETSERPVGSSIYVGFMYFDTSSGINKPIYASAISGNTVTWVDATGATV